MNDNSIHKTSGQSPFFLFNSKVLLKVSQTCLICEHFSIQIKDFLKNIAFVGFASKNFVKIS